MWNFVTLYKHKFLTKLNLEAMFVTYLLFLIIWTKIYLLRTISNLLIDKHSITLNVNINAHIIYYNTFKVVERLN